MKLKKLLSLLLCVTMFFSVIGTLSFADEVETEEEIIEEVIEQEIIEEEIIEEEVFEEIPDVVLLGEETFVTVDNPVAKVGNTEYATIDEAVAAWTSTNNSTLTLLSNVTLSSTIELNSTEYHILDLGTYTMTGANKKSVISILPKGRTSASHALDIKADSENPGGITAVGSGSWLSQVACILSKGNGTKDRPITRIYGGNFKGSYAIHHSGSNGSKCPHFYIYGGTFDAPISTDRAILQISGGTFNKTNSISPDNTAYTQITGGRFYELNNNKMSNLEQSVKWIYATKKVDDFNALNYDVTVYVDEDGYYVVEKDITKVPEFEAIVSVSDDRVNGQLKSTLVFSKAYKEGLGYVKAPAAIENTPKGKIVLKEVIDTNITPSGDLTIDITDEEAAFTGDVNLTNKNATFSVIYEQTRPYEGNVTAADGYALKITEEIVDSDTFTLFAGTTPIYIKRTYSNATPVAKIGDKPYADFVEALSALGANETLTLLDNVTISELFDTNINTSNLPITEPCTIDGNGKTITFLEGTIGDRNNVSAAFNVRENAPTTFKNLTIDMSKATAVDFNGNRVRDLKAIATKSSITVEGCTFIGNPEYITSDTKNYRARAITFGEGYRNDDSLLANMEISISNSKFFDWGNRAINDNDNGGDVKKVSVTGCNFNGSKVQLSASEEVVFTGNTLENTNLSIASNTNKTGLKVTATGNTITETGAVSGLIYEVHAIGEGVNVQEEIGTYVAEYDGKQYFTLDAAIAKAKATIAADATASRDIKLFNNIADVNDDTLYYVYDEQPDKLEITFDFGGGVNSGNYEFVKYYCSYMESITAPTDIKKEGYFFKGWDTNGDGVYDKSVDAVPDKAWEPKTYTAIWQSLNEYGFKITLNPAGGTKIEGEERSMKVNPGEYFLIEVTVNDRFGNENWNDADITFTYDNSLFDFVYGDGVEKVAGSENKLRFRVYGADRVNGSLTKQISFKAKEMTTGSKTGKFVISEATVDTGWAANRIDATPAMENADASVSVFYTYDVTLGEGLKGNAIATTDANYVGKIDPYDGEYNYEVWVECGSDKFKADINETTGEFTVKKELIKGDMTIELTLIGLKGVATDDIEIYEYIGSVALVLLDAEDTREYTYNSGIMYRTPWYDKANATNGKVRFAYLVDTKDFVKDNTLDDTKADYYAKALNTEENKKIALAKIGVTKDGDNRTNETLVFEPGDVNKAGNTTVIDINDVQATWNCYNGNDSEQINVNMPLYLRADINRDMQVNSTDVSEVYELVE